MGKSGKEQGEPAEKRKERLAAELRANLKRRKARARGAQAEPASTAPLSTVKVTEKPG